MKKNETIAIVGASGFVGRALIERLAKDKNKHIVAVSRSPLPDELLNLKNVSWRQCDLHSLLQTENALEGIDSAYYLVHSMTESVRFREGSFQDVDLALADHFGRSIEKNKITKVTYLSGLIPPKRHLSPHLGSRLEVEDLLKYYQPKTTTLRAGIIIGPQGSSSELLEKLTRRFPVLPCPISVNNLCQPIYIDEAVECLIAAHDDISLEGMSVDIGGPDRLSYRKIIEIISNIMGKKEKIYVIPFPFPDFTKKLLARRTNTPYGLVYPLFESMKEQMICRKNFHYRKKECVMTVKEAFKKSISLATRSDKKSVSEIRLLKRPKNEIVRSIQRMNLSPLFTARDVANYYLQFLGTSFIWLIKTKNNYPLVSFHLNLVGFKLLELEFIESRSRQDRSLFMVRGGLLVANPIDDARLEFRHIPSNGATLVCVHGYKPRLPWVVYRWTQAIAHVWIIRIFEAWLNSKNIKEDFEKNSEPFFR